MITRQLIKNYFVKMSQCQLSNELEYEQEA